MTATPATDPTTAPAITPPEVPFFLFEFESSDDDDDDDEADSELVDVPVCDASSDEVGEEEDDVDEGCEDGDAITVR